MQRVQCVNTMIYALNSAETTTQIAYFQILKTHVTIWHSDLLLLRVFHSLFAYSWAFLSFSVLLIPQFTTGVLILASIMIWYNHSTFKQSSILLVSMTKLHNHLKICIQMIMLIPIEESRFCMEIHRKMLNVSMVYSRVPTIMYWYHYVLICFCRVVTKFWVLSHIIHYQ